MKTIYKVEDRCGFGARFFASEKEASDFISDWPGHKMSAKEIPDDEFMFAVYFSDNPYSPAYFCCRYEYQAREFGELYIRQWGLCASISRIEIVC